MDTFPEESLNLSAAEGFGYFPADINQTVDGGNYTIIRKIGWGRRSSTWLVTEGTGSAMDYWAMQVFTVAESRDVESRLLPILANEISRVGTWITFPNFQTSFWERSVHGEHLCFIMSQYGDQLSDVLRDATNSGRRGLPVHVVQYTAGVILDILKPLHKQKVLHGGVELGNIVFWPASYGNELEEYLDKFPPATTQIIDGLPVVLSQPLNNYGAEWDAPMDEVANWMLILAGFGHSMYYLVSPYTPEVGLDYSFAPETLLSVPTCRLATDAWMLGCLVFQLLTGKRLFNSTSITASERLGEVRDILRADIPDIWTEDANAQALSSLNPSTKNLEQRLKEVLTPDEFSAAYAFLQRCLVLDPAGRASAKDLKADEWVQAAAKCSCCY
ncbi:CMGC/SRPK protein kinase [Ephemerocybe angulata]|uniref:CMGC/SRPK protein kinase n=1 Tax=Ephemerocybe angulata TaxID=980116 RepID=A0A8H6HAX3_9AGAR|nr:CMGC/SRPK protein kinase [Tulosesus angulatus]